MMFGQTVAVEIFARRWLHFNEWITGNRLWTLSCRKTEQTSRKCVVAREGYVGADAEDFGASAEASVWERFLLAVSPTLVLVSLSKNCVRRNPEADYTCQFSKSIPQLKCFSASGRMWNQYKKTFTTLHQQLPLPHEASRAHYCRSALA